MWIVWSSWKFLCLRYERRDFNLDFGALIDQAGDVEQRRGWKSSPERFLPGGADTRTGGLVFLAAGQIPGQPNDMLGAGAGLGQQLDDPPQRDGDLTGHIGLIVALLVAAGLAGQHYPFAGTIDFDAVRKAARLLPVGRLQDTHELNSPNLNVIPGWSEGPDLRCAIAHLRFALRAPRNDDSLSTNRTHAPTSKWRSAQHCIGIFARCKSIRGRRYRPAPSRPPRPRASWPASHSLELMDRTPSKPKAALWMVGWLALMLTVAVAGRETTRELNVFQIMEVR